MIHLFIDASAASTGSGPTYVRNVVPRLSARHDVRSTILLSWDLLKEFQDSSNVLFLGFPGSSSITAGRFLRAQLLIPELIRCTGADVLISTGNVALFHSPVPQILLSGNALYTSDDFFRDVLRRRHYRLWLDTRLKGLLARYSIRAASCTIAPSQAFAIELTRWTDTPVIAVHHGFNRDLFFCDPRPLPAEVAQKLEREGNEIRLLFVSHYNYYRNFETLIRALPLLISRAGGRKVKLFLTCRLQPGHNPGSYCPAAASAVVRELGVTSNVIELGAIPYRLLHHVYRACDMYVSPAYVETFAHPLVEAMGSGLPVVVSDLPVHREICGDAARYFPPFSPLALAEEVVQVWSEPATITGLRARGLERAQNFSWELHVERVVTTAHQLLGIGIAAGSRVVTESATL